MAKKVQVVEHKGPPLPTLYSRPESPHQVGANDPWVVKNSRGTTVGSFRSFEAAEQFIAKEHAEFREARDSGAFDPEAS